MLPEIDEPFCKVSVLLPPVAAEPARDRAAVDDGETRADDPGAAGTWIAVRTTASSDPARTAGAARDRARLDEARATRRELHADAAVATIAAEVIRRRYWPPPTAAAAANHTAIAVGAAARNHHAKTAGTAAATAFITHATHAARATGHRAGICRGRDHRAMRATTTAAAAIGAGSVDPTGTGRRPTGAAGAAP
jgi:hypothetical protein